MFKSSPSCPPGQLSSPVRCNSPYTTAKQLFPTPLLPHSLLLKLFCCLECPCLQFLPLKIFSYFKIHFKHHSSSMAFSYCCQALNSKARQRKGSARRWQSCLCVCFLPWAWDHNRLRSGLKDPRIPIMPSIHRITLRIVSSYSSLRGSHFALVSKTRTGI